MMKSFMEKGSLLGKMPGDDWQKFANLRVLLGYMYAQPGKKLLFMGGEIGQWGEWNHEESLDWHLLEYPLHSGLHRWVGDLNRIYRDHPALYEMDHDPAGFEWIDCNDSDNSVISLIRKGNQPQDLIVVVVNLTPVPRHNYRLGVPFSGFWQELGNSDATIYGGSGQGNLGGVEASPVPFHGRPFSLNVIVPPLSLILFKPESR